MLQNSVWRLLINNMKRKIIPFQNIEACLAEYQQDLNIYLILDAAQVSDDALTFINKWRDDTRLEFYSLFAGTTEGNAPFEVAPVLIIIHDFKIFENMTFNFLQETWRTQQALNIVLSTLDLTKFVKKMKRYLTVEFPDGSQKLFRWFDPRIVNKIDKILDEGQEYEFFNDIGKWVISIRNYQDVNSNQIMLLENT